MTDAWSPLSPAGRVKFRVELGTVAAWQHPQYMLREMAFVFPGGRCRCPLSTSGYVMGARWKLDRELHVVPGSLVVF